MSDTPESAPGTDGDDSSPFELHNESEDDSSPFELHNESEDDDEINDDAFAPSKHSELSDYKTLVKVIEHNHRADLTLHLVVAERLQAEDRARSRERPKPKRIVPSLFTAWPLRRSELAKHKTGRYDLGGLHNDGLDERQEFYETYRLPTARFWAPPPDSQALAAEISAAGIRALPSRPDRVLTNDEIEQSLFLPHLHESMMQFMDGLMDAFIVMRKHQARSASRHRLARFAWQDVLNVAAVMGVPALDEDDKWVTVLETARVQCQDLFGGHAAPFRVIDAPTIPTPDYTVSDILNSDANERPHKKRRAK